MFNIVDDDLPSSRQFLRQYKTECEQIQVHLHSPRRELCALFSLGTIFDLVSGPAAAGVQPRWMALVLEKDDYSNEKLKARLNWTPRVSMADGLKQYFEACRNAGRDA